MKSGHDAIRARRRAPRLIAGCAVIVVACFAAPQAGALDLLKSVEEAVGLGGSTGGLTDQEIGDGLREALRVGTERVVGQVGAALKVMLTPT